jgi:predicted acyltransferase
VQPHFILDSLNSFMTESLQRNESLDALRGFAILTMVLSGSIAFNGVLPGWMYHAQVPPPLHKFIPTIPGITWVDLVFPFFLFSMGAAIPLSLKNKVAEMATPLSIVWIALRRYFLLVFFAIFFQHMKVWSLAEIPVAKDYALAMLAFGLMFAIYYQPLQYKKQWRGIKICCYAVTVFLLWYLPFKNNKGFQINYSDIIIIVLANMAFFGTIIWVLTKDKPLWRLAILPFLAAMIISGKVEQSFTESVVNFSPAPWMYQFYYLKYLFIIIPGTFAGEWMMANNAPLIRKNNFSWVAIGGCCMLLIIGNLYFLYSRQLLLNLASSLLLISCLWLLLSRTNSPLLKKYLLSGLFLLFLGLLLEPTQGGIKKDPSTFSYYFVTTGLAFFMLILFSIAQEVPIGKTVIRYLSLNGKNPMLAYVAGALLLTPLLYFTHTQPLLNQLNQHAFAGFMKGVLFTLLVSVITIVCTKRNLFWKT